jgi:hypothetical protein
MNITQVSRIGESANINSIEGCPTIRYASEHAMISAASSSSFFGVLDQYLVVVMHS